MAAAVDDQDRIGRHFKQQPVARFHMPDAGIVAFHRLLRIDQPPLQGRNCPQVAAEHDNSSRRSGLHRGVKDWDVATGPGGMVEVSPSRFLFRRRVFHQRFGL